MYTRRVPQVAIQEGEGGDALLVGEHRGIEDDPPLVLGPPLDVLAADMFMMLWCGSRVMSFVA